MLALDMFRFNMRMKALTIAIGICIAFIVGSFAFANGLGTTVKNITEKFESEGAIAFVGDDLADSVIDLSKVEINAEFASIGLVFATVNESAGGVSVFFAVDDPANTLKQNLNPPFKEILSGKLDELEGLKSINTSKGSVELWANRTYESNLFPDYWHLINWADLEELRPVMNGTASFLIFSEIDSGLVKSLQSQGLTVHEMTAILGYFSAGTREVEADLWLIIIPSSFIVAMLVYSAVAMEAKDRAREIAILKTMGANNRKISGIFLLQAFALSVAGGLLGIMIGIMIAYAISTSSSIVIANSLFFLRVTEYSMLIAFLCSVIAGVGGAIIPIRQAVRKSVREAMG